MRGGREDPLFLKKGGGAGREGAEVLHTIIKRVWLLKTVLCEGERARNWGKGIECQGLGNVHGCT